MLQALFPFLISFLATAVATPAVIALAHRLGWVARPRDDRWHRRPTALMGGIAIFAGAGLSWALYGDSHALLPVFIAAVGVFVLGFVDDRVTLRPHVKLIGQIAATGYLVLSGVRFEAIHPVISLALTFMWVIGITNAVNLLDNMDGLAAGVTLISALAMAAYCLNEGSPTAGPAVLALAGACAGFLIYNFNPAKIFMGDCGSMFLGFSLAALAVQGTHRSAPNLVLSLLVPAAVLAIPIFDTTLVSVSRTLHGRAISQGGRDHSSHRMVALGLSERGTVIVFYCLSALFGGVALLASSLPLIGVAVLAALLFTALMVLGLFLGFLKVYEDDARPASATVLLQGQILYKKQLLQVLVDIVLVPLAFVGAHLLRFEGELPNEHMNAVLTALPVVLMVKLVSLGVCRAYRGVWRMAGMADALTALAGSTVGSMLSAALFTLLPGFDGLSRAGLIIDWLLFTVLAIAARMSYVALRQLFGMLPGRYGPRVVILGAGSETLTLLHKLRDPMASRRADVLGILDDDPGKQKRAVDGVPILGQLSELPGLVQEQEVSCCLLGVPPHSKTGERILAFCRANKIAVYRDLDSPPLPV
jgi:UDP-GlcNAc:undecaprenyl-phosphate/decaprenyl-phosphate GlcNAc-1-phosphate transferase